MNDALMNEATIAKLDKGGASDALDPVSRTSEILFGLIMVLSFTCSISAASVGREDIRELLISALGCNTAWGIIDEFGFFTGAFRCVVLGSSSGINGGG
jgi:hypothetical protein